MYTKKSKQLVALTLTFSIVAFAISIYAGVSSHNLKASLLDVNKFNAKVEKGIEAYVKKQQEKQYAPPAAANEPVDVSVDDDAMKGDPDAPVTIIEFSEYQCPFCKRYIDQTFVQIDEKYIQTGKVKYVFRDFPLGFHPNAKPAAIATECAREQGGDEMYWKYHDKLFEDQKLDAESLKKYASNLNLDISKFNDCLDNEKYADEVEKDMADGQKAGIRGTPGFFVNGRMISGAVPFEVFEKAIEEELNK